jgi:HK97 family phage portal protein
MPFGLFLFMFEKLFRKKEFTPGISAIKNFFFGKVLGRNNDFADKYHSWVYRCVNLIAQEVGSANLRLYKKVSGDNDKEQADHELLKLFNNPNPEMTRADIFEHISASLDIDGNAYIFKAKAGNKTKELWPLRADWVKIAPSNDKERLIEKYIYFNGEINVDLMPEEVIHIRNYNPKYFDRVRPFKGIGTVQASISFIDEDETIRERNKKFFENGAFVGGVLEFDGKLNEQQKRRIESNWRKQQEGIENANKTPILHGGLKYNKTQFNQRELAFIDQRKLDRDDIFLMFGIPKGLMMSEDVNLANAKMALWAFTRFTIKPRLKKIQDALNASLVSEYGLEYYLEFDNPVPDDRAEIVSEYAQGWNKWLTTNDIRREEGLPELDGGDEMRASVSPIPQQLSVKKKLQNQDERIVRGEKAWEVMIKMQSPFEEKYKNEIRKYFHGLRERTLKKISEKSFKEKGIIEKNREVGMIVDLLTPLQRELLEKSGKLALLRLGLENNFDFTPDISNGLDKYDLTLAESIAKTTDEELRKIINEAGDEGLGMNAITEKVNEYFNFADEVRAERIARTETIRTSNAGMESAWNQSGIVSGKEWYTAQDERTCELCSEMDGQTTELNEAYFYEGDEFMGMAIDFRDIGEPPLHANCRCVLLPILK